MSCYGNGASTVSVNLPNGTVDINGNSTLTCCDCLCEGICPAAVLANQFSVPNGGSINFSSVFSNCHPELLANCSSNMSWVLQGRNGGAGYPYAYGTIDNNGCLVFGGNDGAGAVYDPITYTLTSYYNYSDAVSIVVYSPGGGGGGGGGGSACSPSSPPAPPS
jgi:hypothetical protein